MLPKCPKCDGKLYVDIWEEPNDLACIRCGARLVGPLTKESIIEWVTKFKDGAANGTV